MDDPILPTEPQATPAPVQPAPDARLDRLEQTMGQIALAQQELSRTVADAAQRLTAPAAPPPTTNNEFLERLATDPQGVIREVAAQTARQVTNESLTPQVMQVMNMTAQSLLAEQAARVDAEIGAGTFDELFRPQLEKDLAQLRLANPAALADRGTVEALVNRLYGGANFPVLMERRRNLESIARTRGLSHLVPQGGVPRLRSGGTGEADLPEDVHQIIADWEKQTGERIDRKEFAKLYYTGSDSGPGRHRTTLQDFLSATGASPDTKKMYLGERG